MEKTTDFLKKAFAGESQASRRYLAYAKRADEEGFPQVARLFRAAAAAETIHAHNHLNVLNAVKDTATNLDEALSGEQYEFTQMYPEMLAAAREERRVKAIKSFNYANEVEKVHARLFEHARARISEGKDLSASDVHVCPVCGNTVEGVPPERCPICGTPGKEFAAIA